MIITLQSLGKRTESRGGEGTPGTSTVLKDQPDYDHLAQWKKSLDDDRSAPVIFTVIFLSICMTS